MQNTTSIKISSLRNVLRANIHCNISTTLRSHPGIGKSEIAEQTYQDFAAKGRFSGGFFTFSTTEFNAIELGGLWHVVDGKTIRCPIGMIPLDKPVFILIDEFADCPQHEQSGWYQLANNHMIGGHKLCKGSYVMSATNRPEDNAAAGEISTAFKSRNSVVDLRADWECTVAYGVEQGWHSTILWFIRAFGRDVIDNGFDANCSYAGSTPRDFEHLNRLEVAGLISKKDIEASTMQVVSFLGTKSGYRYHAFRSMPMPDTTPVFKNPATAEIPDRVEDQMILGAAIIGAATPANFQAIATYALRCNRVMGFGLCYDLSHKLPAFKDSPAFTPCALAYMDLAQK
jgi:hypothetical protein